MVCAIALVPRDAQAEPVDWSGVLWFDRGDNDEMRHYWLATECTNTPCVITQDGALRFNRQPDRELDIEMWLVHARSVTRLDYFEKRSRKDYVMLERALNLHRNRPVWSLSENLETGRFETAYISGVTRQYRLREGDLIVVEVRDRANPSDSETFYFRYHRSGFQLRLDFGLVVPINAIRVPEPSPPWMSGSVGAAGTLQLRKTKDPEGEYSRLESLWLSVHPTVFLGLMVRDLEQPGRVPEDREQADIFGGVGITLFDFLFVGWGGNLINGPRFSQPFVGVHVRNIVQYVAELNRSSPAEWDEYMDREKSRPTTYPELPVIPEPPDELDTDADSDRAPALDAVPDA
ncbi:MAG: hypothetical protein AAF658_18470, partial [Myxococcota bacterium]